MDGRGTARFDLLIVGAGPAGSAAALGALSANPAAKVGLIDRAAFPRDKVCGDGLTPPAVAVLEELGVRDVLAGYEPVRWLRSTGPGGSRLTVDLSDPAYVLPRRVLDARLVALAISRGAEFIRVRVSKVAVDGDLVLVNDRWSAPCVVAADGANSVVRSRLGLAHHPVRHTGVALRGYASVPSGEGRMDVRFAPGRLWPAYGWMFTAGDGRANVGVGTFDGTTQPNRRELTTLLDHLFGDVELDPDSMAGHRLPLSATPPTLTAGPVLLAGDAAGLVDPVTGEGVHTALLSGMLAGQAAVVHSQMPARVYRRMVRRRMGPRLRHIRIAARALRRPALVDAVFFAAAGDARVASAVAELALGSPDRRAWSRIVFTAFSQGNRRHMR